MEKITLSYVGRFTTNKEGEPLVSKKTGKPYTSLRVKCNEYGDKYLSGFDSFATKDWKEGMTVELEVEKKGEYLNFSVPKKEDIQYRDLANKLTTLTLRHDKLVGFLMDKGIVPRPTQKIPGTEVEYPKEEVGVSFSGPGVGGANEFGEEDVDALMQSAGEAMGIIES